MCACFKALHSSENSKNPVFTLQLPTQRAYAHSWLTEEKNKNGILKQAWPVCLEKREA